jgi:hypothetical protein
MIDIFMYKLFHFLCTECSYEGNISASSTHTEAAAEHRSPTAPSGIQAFDRTASFTNSNSTQWNESLDCLSLERWGDERPELWFLCGLFERPSAVQRPLPATIRANNTVRYVAPSLAMKQNPGRPITTH